MQIDDFAVKSLPSIDTLGLSERAHPLRVCIVTEEIIGPVRNGGIASTYYHLSKGLAAHGHEVHVLFLKGPVVQDETPQHWVEHFAEFGVTLHYLEMPKRPLWGAATEWQERFAAAYNWLRAQENFDVIHGSEWRGGLVYALMAKRLGLAFQESLFVIKTSSPHIWNRHYQMQPIERRELVLAAYAEQRCVELADMVVGGSAHLISFMERIGYRIPRKNVFVQPNIVDFSKVTVEDARPPRAPGDVVKSRELIFFGRLEGRKGVELMCNALDILRERGVTPERVSFMGKWGAPLAMQGGMKVEEYLDEKSRNWDFPVEYITDKNQPAALSHMCSRDMIAVMPSLIENSTMAVYETLENNIPFIATAVGGTPELIDPADHERCLVAPKSTALADQLERALREGQPIARASFSNAVNLETWYGFHACLGEQINEQGRKAALARICAPMDAPGPSVRSLAYLVLLRRGNDPAELAHALCEARPDQVILGYTDAGLRTCVQKALENLRAQGIDAQGCDCIGQAAGDALNRMALSHSADAMIVAHGTDVWPQPEFTGTIRDALGYRPDCLLTGFFSADDNMLGLPMGSDVASQFFTSRAYGPEIFAMRTDLYHKIGPFEPYDLRCGLLHEYITRACEVGGYDMMVIPQEGLVWPGALEAGRALADDSVYAYLKVKALIDGSSLAERKIALASLHQSRGGGGALGDNVLRDGARSEEEPLWLTPVEWERHDFSKSLKRALVVALDETSNSLWLYARGMGERRLTLRDTVQQTEQIKSHGEADDENHITLSRFDIPPDWEEGASFPLSWGLYDQEIKQRSTFLRINKISQNCFSIASRNPVLSKSALSEMVERQQDAALIEISLDHPKQTLSDVPTDMDALLSLTRNTGLTNGHKPVKRNDDDDNIGSKFDELLALAYNTGRVGLERRTVCAKSKKLLLTLNDAPSPVEDVRSFLNPPKKDEGWAEGGWLTGWVWDRTSPDRSLHVVVRRHGQALFMVRAETHMPLLGRRTPGLEHHGFRIPVLADFLSDDTAPLLLEIWENSAPLRHGQLFVTKGATPILVPLSKAAA